MVAENRTGECEKDLKKTEKGFTKGTDGIVKTAVKDMMEICKKCKYSYCRTKSAIYSVLLGLPENEQYKTA